MPGRPLYTSSSGVEYRWVDEGDHKVILASQDTTDILDRAQAMATHNDGYTPSRELRRAATIPASVRLKWLLEEGWDCLQTGDPEVQRKLMQKLDSSDYRHLRLAHFRLGDHWRHGI